MAAFSSPEESRHGLGLDQFTRLVEMVQHHGGRVDAEGVVDRGEQLAWMNGIGQRRRAGLVGLAVDVAPPDASAGDHGRVAIGPVVAPIRAVAVTRSADPLLRTAAEL